MAKKDPGLMPTTMDGRKKAQAAATAGQAVMELTVFGAILIFMIGTILSSSVSVSYEQNQNFKTMRMAMLASWNSSTTKKPFNISRNTASILFVEDRFSPQVSKYGSLERTPDIANGGGTFSYMLEYPINATEVHSNLPVMDFYINGQHFPFTSAGYVDKAIMKPRSSYLWCSGDKPTPLTSPPSLSWQTGDCAVNQCLRNYREWRGGSVSASDFDHVMPNPSQSSTDACYILQLLDKWGLISTSSGGCTDWAGPNISPTGSCDLTSSNPSDNPSEYVCTTATTCAKPLGLTLVNGVMTYVSPVCSPPPTGPCAAWTEFECDFLKYAGKQEQGTFGGSSTYLQLNAIQSILVKEGAPYKLFYFPAVNGTSQFYSTPPGPPTCASHPCYNKELSNDLVLPNTTWAAPGPICSAGTPSTECTNNTTGDLMYDLQRNGLTNKEIEDQFSTPLRNNMAWQWGATAGVPGKNGVNINQGTDTFPSYDIDGRLKTVTLYYMDTNPTTGETIISYEDPQLGDIDGSWDMNSCGPRPGLLNGQSIYTFTSVCSDGTTCKMGTACSDGTTCPAPTYLEIKEGRLYNPENPDLVVRSVNKRYTVDLISRMVQLSNNTNRFCSSNNVVMPCVGAVCVNSICDDGITACTYGSATACPDGTSCPVTTNCITAATTPDSSTIICPKDPLTNAPDPNPVEVCVGGTGNGLGAPGKYSCFYGANIKQTCFDTSTNMLYARSRLEERRGHFWITNASGQLGVP